MPPKVLLTGPPGCGKTTALLRALDRIARPAVGFYTEEVRAGGVRVGFDVVALDGSRAPLARVGAPGPRVGRYGVDVASFERVACRALDEGLRRSDALIVIDEIGKMELLSEAFTARCLRVFDAGRPVLGTVLRGRHPVADRIRARPDVRVVEVTREARDRLPGWLARLFADG